MKQVLNPGITTNTVSLIDHIVYSRVEDLQGNPLELDLSIMAAMGNSEMQAAMGWRRPAEILPKKPCLVWFNGGGWRGVDKNGQLGELARFAKEGYVVACVYYRSSAQGHCPAQIIDCKTAIRFLRAHCEQYCIDPDRIAVMGRSAGGHLSVMVGLNDDKYISDEWAGYSSRVQAVVNMFGPTNVYAETKKHLEEEAAGRKIANRWNSALETHDGALLGGPRETLLERAKMYSPYWNLTESIAPTIILHGTADPAVNHKHSEDLYDALCELGKEEQTELYLIPGAAHGSPEFFQEETKDVILRFLNKWV